MEASPFLSFAGTHYDHGVNALLPCALLTALACGPDPAPAPSSAPSVTEQVVELLEARHGERFGVRFVGGGINEGNLFDGPARTYEAELRPAGGGPVAHAHVRVEGGRVVDIEEDVLDVRASAALRARLEEQMKGPLPELESVCVRLTYEPGTTPVVDDPSANVRRARVQAHVGGLPADAVLSAHERVREAARRVSSLGREPGGLTVVFFEGSVPSLLASTPCTTENTTGLTLGAPTLIIPLGDVDTSEGFARSTTAIGFGRRGSLADVLAR